MIKKPFEPPIKVEKLAVLKRRLPVTHPKWQSIDFEHKNRVKGYEGEKSLKYYLDILPEEKYDIFHNLRLHDGKRFFQIDILLLCLEFGLILEAKKTGDEIIFEKYLNQTTRIKNGKKIRMKNPVLQAKFQAIKLKNWLCEQRCAEFPIFYLFVNSKEETCISTDPGNELNRYICNSEGLIDKIMQLEKFCKNHSINKKDLQKIEHLLLKKHTPDDPDILQEYQLDPTEILTGVICPKCTYAPMDYSYGTWCCPHCGTKSKGAPIQALQDFTLLIKPFITNADARNFLHIKSRKAVYAILTSMQLPYSGERKARVYYPPKKSSAPHA